MNSDLSVTIATFNEESNLERCLRSVAWADEIVIVDDCSTDRTVEIARRFTDRIIVSASHGSFHVNKNLAIENARCHWILSLDADEVVDPQLQASVREAISTGNRDGYLVNRKNFFLGQWIRGCGWYPDQILRLFRKGASSWPLQIHRTPVLVTGGEPGRLAGYLEHYSYTSLEQYFEKFNRYTTRLAEEYEQAGDRATSWNLLIKPVYWFGYKYFLKLGFRDGIRGLFISLSSGLTIFVSYLKLMHKKEAK